MTRMMMAAVGLLLFASVGSAQPAPVDERLAPQATAGGECCGEPASCGCFKRLWQWMTYRPLSRPGLCGCCRQPMSCRPPLYFWLLDSCDAGCGAAYPLRAAPRCNSCP